MTLGTQDAPAWKRRMVVGSWIAGASWAIHILYLTTGVTTWVAPALVPVPAGIMAYRVHSKGMSPDEGSAKRVVLLVALWAAVVVGMVSLARAMLLIAFMIMSVD